MANIIGSYTASDLGLKETDFGVAYLHEEIDYNNAVAGYWWLDNTHHDFSPNLGIYKTVKMAEEALKRWADL